MLHLTNGDVRRRHQSLRIRKNPKAWGGIQMVLCGDFFQLPPISKRFSPNLPEDTFFNRGFTFQAPVWNQMEMESVLLEKVGKSTWMSRRLVHLPVDVFSPSPSGYPWLTPFLPDVVPKRRSFARGTLSLSTS